MIISFVLLANSYCMGTWSDWNTSSDEVWFKSYNLVQKFLSI